MTRVFAAPRVQLGLLVLLVLGIYYPVIFSDVNIIDDQKMIMGLSDVDRLDLKGLFFPAQHGSYYRPLLALSFVLDKVLWDMDPTFLHLENMLIHLVNVFLVYMLARQVLRYWLIDAEPVPFLAALIFALHPINVEPIAWISGRTDPLATVFLLSSLLLFFKGLEKDSSVLVGVSSLVLLGGATVKETVVFFAPVSIAIMYVSSKGERARRVRNLLFGCGPFAISFFVYLGLRTNWFSKIDQGMNLLKTANHYGLYDTFRVVFKIVGFYTKKLFIPYPLNFAILDVSNWYVLLGCATVIVIGLLCRKCRNVPSFSFAITVYMMIPAIIVAFIGIAWTPLAERYLYIPSIFWSFAVAFAGYRAFHVCNKDEMVVPLIMLILLPVSVTTSRRVLVWQDNSKLYADTLKKSPGFNSIRNELGIALANRGNVEAAKQQLLVAIANDRQANNPLYYINYSFILAKEGNFKEAHRVIIDTLNKNPHDRIELYKALIKINTDMMMSDQKISAKEKLKLFEENYRSWQYIFQATHDSFAMYRAGQSAIAIGNKRQAGDCFLLAFRNAPVDAYYREPARKLATKLLGRKIE